MVLWYSILYAVYCGSQSKSVSVALFLFQIFLILKEIREISYFFILSKYAEILKSTSVRSPYPVHLSDVRLPYCRLLSLLDIVGTAREYLGWISASVDSRSTDDAPSSPRFRNGRHR